MRVVRSLEEIRRLGYRRTRVTIGRFQGLHRGHRALIAALDEGVDAGSGPKVVITFDPAPEDVLQGKKHSKLFNLEDKIVVLRELGVDCVFLIPFSQDIAELSAEEFAREYIFSIFDPDLIVVGYDFAFGKNREGDIETLRALKKQSTRLIRLEPLCDKGEIISTSLIRREIQAGNVRRAAELLGRPYYLSGTVVHGEKRGRTLGFPTINLFYGEQVILPKNGVYAVTVTVDAETHKGVCNIGTNPTFAEGREVKWECHILDFDRDIYDASVKVRFIERLRDEKKFSSKEELIQTIKNDIQIARTKLTFF